MRSLIILAMFTTTLAHAAWNGYTEDRDLALDAGGISELDIEAGAGSLVVSGREGLDRILVTATIRVPDKDDEDALKRIEKDMRLSLDEAGGKARLVAVFDSRGWNWGDSPTIDLDVQVPRGLAVEIEDGSGSLEVVDVYGSIDVEDGSGSLSIRGAESVKVDDGSGSVTVTDVTGDVEIEDGSGSITVERVGGSVIIDDGSGGIDVEDVEHDLTIVDDGSGGLNATNVRGDVNADG